MPNVMVTLPNIGGALCSTPQSLADAHCWSKKGKGKGFPYSIPSVGPGADPGVQAVSLQVTVSHPPRGRLPCTLHAEQSQLQLLQTVHGVDDLRSPAGSVAEWLRHWTCNSQVASSIPGTALSSNNLGQSCSHPRASAGRSGLAMA